MEWSLEFGVNLPNPGFHFTLLHIILGGTNVLDDFVLMNYKFEDKPHLNIYPLGDVHIGSKEFDLELFKKWIEVVTNDPNGAVVIIGDMMNMGKHF